MASELFYDLALIAFGNGILLTVTVLEAALLRFEWLQLCYSISAQTRYEMARLIGPLNWSA